jgi:tetratricopeptide (TPR) repeat protein
MKRYLVTVLLLVLPAVAQQRQNFTINVGTPEGQMLQSIGQEPDEGKKVALMQEFLDKYPKHEGAGWVCVQLQGVYLNQKAYDKALDAGMKVLESSPDAIDVGLNTIKAAEGKGDQEAVKTAAVKTAQIAHKLTSGKPPADDDEKGMLEHNKEVGNYAEYALYAASLKAKEPKEVAEIGDALEQANPKSQYLWLATPNYLRALGAKACATATKLAAGDSKNGEALLFSADCSWRASRAEGVVSNGTRALEAFNSRPKVEGGNEGGKVGMANFYIGIGNSMQMKYGPANRALRAALPAIKGDSAIYANALFNLGLANYNLGKAIGDRGQMREGLKYFEESSGIASNVQQQASRNATLIKSELGGK